MVTPVQPAPRGDSPASRKARGAFFTPHTVTKYMADWAIRSSSDMVLEPSAGDAAFLVAAVERMQDLSGSDEVTPRVHGVEIHADSAEVARQRVRAAGGAPEVITNDFFLVHPEPRYDVVIGNPPYIRYQDFSGESRARSRAAALRGGVALTGLASSWAAFTVHSALFLKEGGRLALVLPAELLSVNYAAPVRRFLFDRFRDVELVLFEEQLFPDAEADVVLLLADGFAHGPTHHATIRQAVNASSLASLAPGQAWTPLDPSAKWTGSIVDPRAVDAVQRIRATGSFVDLEAWGDTTLGIVTGNNRYFTLSPARVKELGLPRNELLRLSPPGSAHLRGLSLTDSMLTRLGQGGSSIHLFSPGPRPSPAALEYIESGHRTGVDTAYKCRVRKTWYQVPIVPPADLLLTCMNADTPRLTTNEARVHHLNSVHGVYLKTDLQAMGRDLLPIASLNSFTLLNAEIVGRAYGGGILKIEPREADRWAMPAPSLVASRAIELRGLKPRVTRLLQGGRLLEAVDLVDRAMLLESDGSSASDIQHVRQARAELARRRTVRGASGH